MAPRGQNPKESYLALSSLYHLQRWGDWQPVEWTPVFFLKTTLQRARAAALSADTPASSFKIDIFHVFVLPRNLLSYFPVQHRRLPAKEMPLRLWKEFVLKASDDGNLRVLHRSSSLHRAVSGSASPYRNSYFWNCAHKNLLQHQVTLWTVIFIPFPWMEKWNWTGVRRRSPPPSGVYQPHWCLNKNNFCDGSLVDRCIFLLVKKTGKTTPGWRSSELGGAPPSKLHS